MPSIEPIAQDTQMDKLAQDLDASTISQREPAPVADSGRQTSPMRFFGSEEPGQLNNFGLPQTASKKTPFGHIDPFQELSASSPRNRTPKPDSRSGTPKVEILKHGRESRDITNSGPTQKVRKLSPSASVTPASAIPPSTPAIEQTVSEALSEVGKQVDKEVEEALGQAEEPINGPVDPTSMFGARKSTVSDVKKEIKEAASELKYELENEDVRKAMETGMPTAMAEAFETTIKEVAKDEDVEKADVVDSWESAEDEYKVRVYNFPMRPFVSIDVKKMHEPPTSVRTDIMSEIVRLKKGFDQNDRSLVASSQNFIAYASSKHGGIKIIEQENGHSKDVFKDSQQRIFNVAISTTASPTKNEVETVIATADDGTVFWTSVADPPHDGFMDNLEDRGFAFPPIPAADDNTSGGLLKTRARKSARHPEYFAIGRGKSIHIVWPKYARAKYTNSDTNICDSKKYIDERGLKITTGKAGKDFAFSQCDTVIASLDKAGKLKFWDVRELTNPVFASGHIDSPQNLTEPLLTYNTTNPGDKSWPTSLMFLDKERPYMKGIASRYVIVGMKQNHTLQLWDLGLHKPVQEIHLPHEKESDAICSIAYHPQTGIIAVGHPTRNSIYFIHLSAPKYSLSPMSQAKYISRLADGDKSLPDPESTAIMSGIRELSFARKGELRSIDMLLTADPTNASSNYDAQDAPLFELYVMHSKGVTQLQIKREDIGWSNDNKVLHPVDGVECGAVLVDRLVPLQQPVTPSEASVAPSPAPSTVGLSKPTEPRETLKKENGTSSRAVRSQIPEPSAQIDATLARVENKPDAVRAAVAGGVEKEKKKKKRAGETASQVSTTTNPPLVTAASYAQTAQRGFPTDEPLSERPSVVPSPAPPAAAVPTKPGNDSDMPTWAKQLMSTKTAEAQQAPLDAKTIGESVAAQVSAVVDKQIETLYRRFDDDKRATDAAASAKHDAVLRLVSATLTDNVEKSLSRIITVNVRDTVLPKLTETITSTLERRIGEGLQSAVTTAVPKEIRASLPQALAKSLSEPDILNTISDLTATKVAQTVDDAIRQHLTPSFSQIAQQSAQTIAGQVQARVGEALEKAEMQRQMDAAKIDQLTSITRSLSDMVTAMAKSQVDFQNQILDLQQQVTHSRTVSGGRSASTEQVTNPTRAVSIVQERHPDDIELEELTLLLTAGRYEDATYRWLHSPQDKQVSLFDNLFVRCNPQYLQTISTLLALSVGAAVTTSLETNTAKRLGWIEAVLSTVNPMVSLTPQEFNLVLY